MSDSFTSVGCKVGATSDFPPFSGTRVMMMPFYTYDVDNSIPTHLDAFKPILKVMLASKPKHVVEPKNLCGYLTIDEKDLVVGQIQRRPGLHVDGMYKGRAGIWGGSGGVWGSNGMLLASNTSGLCKMWTGELKGFPVGDGDCEHLRAQLGGLKECVMGAGEIFWCAGMLVHESYPAKEPVRRQLIRITLPNTSAWFDGYTPNPLGIKPNGLVLSEKRI